MLSDNDLQKTIEVLQRSHNVIITSHVRPDGDSCGSIMAMTRVLRSMGKKVQPILLSPLAQWYEFLFDEKAPILGNDISVKQLELEMGPIADLIIIVDTNSQVQLPGFIDFLNNCRIGKTVLVIDHHITNDGLGDVQLIDSTAAATGEIIHELIKFAKWTITKEIAEALFAAISTDTGWFRFSSADGRLYRGAADLLDAGVNPSQIYKQLYQNFSAQRMKLLSLILNRIELHFDGRFATQYIMREDFDITGTSGPDTENLIDECQRIASVDAAAMFVELKDGGFRCSLRSKNSIDVRKIAQAHGGGGHTMASGVNLPGPLENAQKLILEAIKQQLAHK